MRDHLGPCARLQIGGRGGLDVIVTSRRHQTFDPEIFLLHGIDVTTRSIVGLKSSQHFRAGFRELATEKDLMPPAELDKALDERPRQLPSIASPQRLFQHVQHVDIRILLAAELPDRQHRLERLRIVSPAIPLFTELADDLLEDVGHRRVEVAELEPQQRLGAKPQKSRERGCE